MSLIQKNRSVAEINYATRMGYYRAGLYDALDSISCVYYGKQCYFANENGTIYSRISCQTLPDIDSAIAEFCKYIDQ